MVAALAAAGALAHPCRAPLARGPRVPAPIVLWNSCGSFELDRGGTVMRLPRHWLAKHGGGTGRRYGAHLALRRTRAGAFVLRLRGRVVWHSQGRYPRDGGDIAFGPHMFAFATYRGGIYVTDLRGPERLVVRGRGLYPYTFTSSGDLIVTGPAIRLVSRSGRTLLQLGYRRRNIFGFDETSETFFFVTSGGRLAMLHDRRVRLARSVAAIDGALQLATPQLLVFTGEQSIIVTHRDGSVVASAHWRRRLRSDSGVAVSSDGRSFAFRLSTARAGARSSAAAVYVLRAGATRARAIYHARLGPSGCAFGAGLAWHGSSLLYSSSDGALAVLGARIIDLTHLALPRRWPLDRPHAAWRSAVHE